MALASTLGSRSLYVMQVALISGVRSDAVGVATLKGCDVILQSTSRRDRLFQNDSYDAGLEEMSRSWSLQR